MKRQKVVVSKSLGSYKRIPIELIRVPENPSRQVYLPIGDLAETIRQHGLLQPILVRKLKHGNAYEVVCGLRRFMACQKAGEQFVPSIILDGASEDQILEMQLVENLQRQDFQPWEELRLVKQLKTRFQLTNAEIASKIGVSDSTVGDLLLVSEALPDEILKQIVKVKGGKSHPKDFTFSKAVLLARSGLPQEKIRELVRLIQTVGYTRVQLARKLAREARSKIKIRRVHQSRSFWNELIRTIKPRLKEFAEYWSDYATLKEEETVSEFHLEFKVTMPKDLAEAKV